MFIVLIPNYFQQQLTNNMTTLLVIYKNKDTEEINDFKRPTVTWRVDSFAESAGNSRSLTSGTSDGASADEPHRAPAVHAL